MVDFIQLKPDSILNASFNVLQNDFTFIVNGEKYHTNKFIASLLSPAVSNSLFTDTSLDSFGIETESRGDFQILLNACSCRKQGISDNHKEFLREILEKLQNQYLQIEFNSNTAEITYENVFSDLQSKLQYPHFYKEIIDKKISVIAENLYQILSKEEERQIISQLDITIVERILSHENLVINTEDQLLEFINSLYNQNRQAGCLYKYVKLSHCSSESLQTFLSEFRIDDITESIWSEIKKRLDRSLRIPISSLDWHRYNYESIPLGTDDFDGIVNTIRKRANNGDIKTEIELTASSVWDSTGRYEPYNAIQYDQASYFNSIDKKNSWICFEFKNHHIIPTHYTIRTYPSGGFHPINHKIEVSLDNVHWEIIHQESGCSFPNGQQVTSRFSIDENQQKEAKFIRLVQTDQNSSGNDQLVIDSLEFYGYLK